MSLTLFSALCLQVLSLVLVRRYAGPGWLTRPFSLFVVTAVVYHGLSEIVLGFPSNRVHSPVRAMVEQVYIDDAALIVSAALLATVLGYGQLTVRTPSPAQIPPAPIAPTQITPPPGLAAYLDWRLCLLAWLPLAAATVHGSGYNRSRAADFGQDSLLTSLSGDLFVAVTIITALAVVLRFGPQWTVVALVVQSAVLATAGQRLEIVLGAIALTLGLRRAGVMPSRRSVVLMVAVATVVALGITSARVEHGRELFYADTGFLQRTEAIGTGIMSSPAGAGDLAAQAAARLDANVFAGQIERSRQSGTPPTGLVSALGSLLVIVPSVVYPAKLEAIAVTYNPELRQTMEFRAAKIDYVPGSIGLYLGAVGPWGLALLMFVFGGVFALVERWVLHGDSGPRLLLFLALVQGALFFERGVSAILICARSAMILILVLGLWHRLRWRLRRPARPGRAARPARPALTRGRTS